MLRFLAPNAITSAAIGFAVLSVVSSLRGDFRGACWWILYCVLTDKLDGIVARALKATSAFGMQLDSLADLISFGVAPAALVAGFASAHPELGWSVGWRHGLLYGIAIFWVCCAAWRLARFNVIAETPGAEKIFFGVPTTYAGGVLAVLTATVIKYGAPSWGGGDGIRALGSLRLDWVGAQLPWIMILGALTMISTLRVPKVGRTRWLITDVVLFGNGAVCYVIGFARLLPEHLTFSALSYGLAAIIYHLVTPANVRPPPLFKRSAT